MIGDDCRDAFCCTGPKHPQCSPAQHHLTARMLRFHIYWLMLHTHTILDWKWVLTANADPRELFQLFNTTFPFLLKYWFVAKPNHIGTTPREATLEDEHAVWGLAIHTQNSPDHHLTLHSCQVKLQRHVTLHWDTHTILLLDKYKIAHASCQFTFPQHKCHISNSPKYVRAGLHHRFRRFIYLF